MNPQLRERLAAAARAAGEDLIRDHDDPGTEILVDPDRLLDAIGPILDGYLAAAADALSALADSEERHPEEWAVERPHGGNTLLSTGMTRQHAQAYHQRYGGDLMWRCKASQWTKTEA